MLNNASIPTMDPNIIMSIVNMKLRDFYDDVEALCDDLELDLELLNHRLEQCGFYYDEDANRYI